MLKMVESVNDQLKQIQPQVADRVTVGCVTCHHGVARPRTLVDELTLTYDKSGADSTASRYRTLRTAYDNSGAYDFRESSLNQLANYAVGKKDYPGAVALLRLNEQYFPTSGMVQFSLGETYRAAGDTAKAVAAYQKAKELDPRNEMASRALKELGR
jgi:tetratricopeptide (TPR) repeat protein